MVVPKNYKKAIQSLWDGRATITVRDGVLNERTGRTEPVERVMALDLPCRISYVTAKSTEPDEEAARVVKTLMLYIDPSVVIPEGSKLTITQKGVTVYCVRSGPPAVYTAHQEIPLELWGGWA